MLFLFVIRCNKNKDFGQLSLLTFILSLFTFLKCICTGASRIGMNFKKMRHFLCTFYYHLREQKQVDSLMPEKQKFKDQSLKPNIFSFKLFINPINKYTEQEK